MSRLTVARILDGLVFTMALMMVAVLTVAMTWDMLTDFGFQHSRWNEPVTRAMRIVGPSILILQGLSFAVFSREHNILSDQMLARFPRMRRFGGGSQSPKSFVWLGWLQVGGGLFVLALYAASGMLY